VEANSNQRALIKKSSGKFQKLGDSEKTVKVKEGTKSPRKKGLRKEGHTRQKNQLYSEEGSTVYVMTEPTLAGYRRPWYFGERKPK